MLIDRRPAGLWLAAAVLSVVGGVARPLAAQTTIVRFAAVAPAASAGVLDKLHAPGATGDVFCVSRDSVQRTLSRLGGPIAAIDSVFLVLDVEPAAIDSVHTAGIPFLHCGSGVPWIKDRAGQGCAPTSADYLDLLRTRAPYAALHCEGRQLRFFFPAQFIDASGAWSIERRPPVERDALQRRRLGSGTFTGLLFTGVLANGVFGIDRDAGGYIDEWTLDKYTHGLAAGVLTFGAMTAGVPSTYAALGICAAGAAFEVTQGYVSNRDIVADCGGALTAWVWHRVWAR
jgi:hypothetical protein